MKDSYEKGRVVLSTDLFRVYIVELDPDELRSTVWNLIELLRPEDKRVAILGDFTVDLSVISDESLLTNHLVLNYITCGGTVRNVTENSPLFSLLYNYPKPKDRVHQIPYGKFYLLTDPNPYQILSNLPVSFTPSYLIPIICSMNGPFVRQQWLHNYNY